MLIKPTERAEHDRRVNNMSIRKVVAGLLITASFRLMRISLKSLLRQVKIIRLTVKKTIRIRLREVDYEEYR